MSGTPGPNRPADDPSPFVASGPGPVSTCEPLFSDHDAYSLLTGGSNPLSELLQNSADAAGASPAPLFVQHTVPAAEADPAAPTGTDDDPVSGVFGAAFADTIMPSFANVVTGTHGTHADAAAGILTDVAAGRPPFRPELGAQGPVQWFVTDGAPRTGRGDAAAIIPVEITVPRGAQVLEFSDSRLRDIYDGFLDEARQTVTEQYAAQYPDRSLTSNRSVTEIARRTEMLAERMTWTEVGNRVAQSDSGIGRVVMGADSFFSQGRPGTFMLTAEPEAVQIRGGAHALLDVVQRHGIRAEPSVVEAAQELAERGAISGRVEGVFRVGGRVLIVAGAAADGWRIYTADDRLRETAEVAGGWAGAAGAVAAYNAWAAPSNVAGPWAWAGNAAISIGVGVAGYFGGEWLAGEAYDLIVDPDPIEVTEP